jgi:hypothetical protein
MVPRRTRYGDWLSWLVCAALALAVANSFGAEPALPVQNASHTPVDFFEDLLTKSPQEREQALASKPEPQRQQILAKLKEYEALDAKQRELRLQATKLRWHLMVLMQRPPTNRAEYLAPLPAEDRRQVEERLQQWDRLPPAIQKVLLASEVNSHHGHQLAGVNTNVPGASPGSATQPSIRSSDTDWSQWQALSPDQREKTLKRFWQFFELTETEKQKTLSLLDDTQRIQTESTVKALQEIPKSQRPTYFNSLKKFSDLPPAQKERYLRMAEEWNQLKPEERQSARYFAAQMPPLPPDLTNSSPPGFMPSTNPRSLPPLPGSLPSTNTPPPMIGVDPP